MRTVLRQTGWALGLLLAVPPAWAQPPAPPPDAAGVHRMVIYNGPVRTVHYVSTGVPPNEAASVRDLEWAENDVAMADQLQELKYLYLRNEREMEIRRHQVQMLLYGYSSETYANPLNLLGPGGYGGWGPYGVTGGYYYPGYGLTGPYAAGYPFGGYGWGVGYGGSGSNSLAYGIGDEGVVKTTLARSLLDAAAPDYAARAAANYNAALARASQYESVRSTLGLKEPLPLPQPPPREEKK